MKFVRIFAALVLPIMLIAVATGALSASTETSAFPAPFDNVRAYAAATQTDGLSYANAGGKLIAGQENDWHTVRFPEGVIAGGIAIDPQQAQRVYVGAANETAIYRTSDAGESWLRIPLSSDYNGAVTILSIDAAQKIVYAGTDQGTLYRLHDVGTSMILAGQQTFDEPIQQVAVDASGSQLAFVRTATKLYRASENGLDWTQVELLTMPTALAVANTIPATFYVGTMDIGILKTTDGYLWLRANDGFEINPGTRLKVDALAIDPLQPDRLYVATSYLFGSTSVHQSPIGISMSENSAETWEILRQVNDIAVTDLLAVSGKSAAVYALFANSRTPFAMGDAQPLIAADSAPSGMFWSDWLAAIDIWQWVIVLAGAISILLAMALVQRSRSRHYGQISIGSEIGANGK